MVHLDGRKMSKSTGNLVFVHELRGQVPAMAIRLALMIHHYRRPWNWTDSLLDEAIVRLDEWEASGSGTAAVDDVRDALDDDLDVPAAMVAIDRAVSAGEGVSEAADLLGVRLSGGA